MKTKVQVIKLLYKCKDHFFSHPMHNLVDKMFDDIQIQIDGLTYEDPTEQQIQQTYKNALSISKILDKVESIEYIYG